MEAVQSDAFLAIRERDQAVLGLKTGTNSGMMAISLPKILGDLSNPAVNLVSVLTNTEIDNEFKKIEKNIYIEPDPHYASSINYDLNIYIIVLNV